MKLKKNPFMLFCMHIVVRTPPKDVFEILKKHDYSIAFCNDYKKQ